MAYQFKDALVLGNKAAIRLQDGDKVVAFTYTSNGWPSFWRRLQVAFKVLFKVYAPITEFTVELSDAEVGGTFHEEVSA